MFRVDCLAKAKPGSITFATSGHGSIQHLAAERFQRRVLRCFIPYKGIGPAMVDLLAGQVDMAIESLSAVMRYVKSGKLRARGDHQGTFCSGARGSDSV